LLFFARRRFSVIHSPPLGSLSTMPAAVEQPPATSSNGVNQALAGINEAVAGLTKKFPDLTKVDSAQNVLATVESPPGQAGRPYIVSTQDGEVIYIPLSKSATRLLVTGKETDDAFAVVASGGSQSDPIGFHYHREAHDVFLCLQGEVNVWANDKCRTMGGGDFASVPPVSRPGSLDDTSQQCANVTRVPFINTKS